MSKSSVRISIPCTEQWADMKSVDGSRFCGNCQKTVVDFTAMTDAGVIRSMARQKGSACDRFWAGQLNRPLRTYSPASTAQWRLLGLLTASLLGWHTTQAQANAQVIDNKRINVQAAESQVKDQPQLNASVSATQVYSSRIITGRVVAESDSNSVSGVTVGIKGTNKSVPADTTGEFRLVIPAEHAVSEIVLSISSVGFVRREISVNRSQQSPLLIAFAEDSIALGEVITVGNYREPSFLDRLHNRFSANR